MICKKKNHIAIILTDIAIVILVGIFEFHFHWKKYKNNDVSFAGVCAKQACSLTCGQYD